MKKFIPLLLCLILVWSVGCADVANNSSVAGETQPDPVEKFFTVGKNEDLTYDFQVLVHSGAALISEKGYSMEPHAELVTDDILKLWAGEGASTRWTRYCDLKNNKVSESFYGVLCETAERVVYTAFKENKHYVIIRDIFDANGFYKEVALEDASMDADPQVDATEDEAGNMITVTYLAGLKREMKSVTIDLS